VRVEAALTDPAVRLGGADCEAVRGGLIAQPAAAVTSLALVAAGGWLLRRRPHDQPGRSLATAYATLVVTAGLGSVAYHGPQPAGAQLLHDLPIPLLVALAAGVPITRYLRRRPALAVGGRRDAWAAGACLLGGGVAYLLGRTGSALCDPGSPVQLHGLWHLFVAGGLAAWGAALWGRGTSRRSRPETPAEPRVRRRGRRPPGQPSTSGPAPMVATVPAATSTPASTALRRASG
jgi:hypothetical protein